MKLLTTKYFLILKIINIFFYSQECNSASMLKCSKKDIMSWSSNCNREETSRPSTCSFVPAGYEEDGDDDYDHNDLGYDDEDIYFGAPSQPAFKPARTKYGCPIQVCCFLVLFF